MLLVILAIAALAILACVVLVSLGKGGELTEFPPDVPPLNLPETGRLGAVDIMALQLPLNLIGYHTQSVDEALRRAAEAISARDTRIAILEQRVSELLSSRLHARQEVHAAPGGGPRTEHEPPAAPLTLPAESDPLSSDHVPTGDEPASADHEPVTWAAPEQPAAAEADPAADPSQTDHSDRPEPETAMHDGIGDETAEPETATHDTAANEGADASATATHDGGSNEPVASDGAEPDRAAHETAGDDSAAKERGADDMSGRGGNDAPGRDGGRADWAGESEERAAEPVRVSWGSRGGGERA